VASNASKTIEECPDAAEDAALVQRSQRGDRAAFNSLVLKYQDRIFRLAMHMVRRREDAFDVAQESFLKAYRGLKRFRGDAAFGTWLYRIAIRTATSHQRRAAARKEGRHVSLHASEEDPTDRAAPDLAAPDSPPDEAASRAELQRFVRQAIQSLDPEYRVIVLLRDIEGKMYEEIADLLQCPIGTVKSRLYRARAELREALAPIIEDAPE